MYNGSSLINHTVCMCIEYSMERARVQCLHTSCGISEIEQVSEANEWDFWYKTTSV